MTRIIITAESTLQPWHADAYSNPRATFDRRLTVTIRFEVRVHGMRHRTMVVHMEARFTNDDDRLREELKRNHWGELFMSVGATGTPDLAYAVMEINDPGNILEWLRIAPDDPIFNTKKRLNDQPVRLPAPDPGERQG